MAYLHCLGWGGQGGREAIEVTVLSIAASSKRIIDGRAVDLSGPTPESVLFEFGSLVDSPPC